MLSSVGLISCLRGAAISAILQLKQIATALQKKKKGQKEWTWVISALFIYLLLDRMKWRNGKETDPNEMMGETKKKKRR